MKRLIILMTVFAASPFARATDGVIEINHAKIMAGGGYPYTISQPGSYRLTGNLTQPNPDTDVIRVNASHVSLDLNGHAILGANTCTYGSTSVTCSGIGAGRGISTTSSPSTVMDLWIRNGRIAGIAGDCITGSWDQMGRIEDISVSECGHYGIQGSNVEVIRSQATTCGSNGIIAEVAIGNRSIYNGGVGVSANSLAKDNVVFNNVGVGIQMTFAGTAIGNVIKLNGGAGIAAGNAFAASANQMRGNAVDTLPPAAISVPAGSNLCGNTPC
jgi:hypothetical protein